MTGEVDTVHPFAPRRAIVRWSESLGMASLWLFVASIALSTAGMYLGLAGMFLGMLGTARPFWVWAKSQAVFWPALGLSTWILICSALESPYDVPAPTAADATRDFLRLAGIPALIVAWWIVRLREQRQRLLFVAALGLLATVLVHFHWDNPASYLNGRRPDFGLGGNGTSVFGALVVVGCLTVGRSWLAPQQRLPAWGVILTLGVFLFFAGQSRSVWLVALVIVAALTAIGVYRRGLGAVVAVVRAHPRRAIAIAAGGVLVATMFGAVILERISSEPATWRALFALQLDQLPSSSIGWRIAMWRIALEQIMAHPVTGVGAGAAETIMAASGDPTLGDRTFPHFHNAYLQVAASLGLPGLALFAAMLFALALPAVRALRAEDPSQRELGRFVVVSGLLIGGISFFQIRFDDPVGMALYVFLSACALACSDARLAARAGEREPASQ